MSEPEPPIKMYILIRDDLDHGMAALAAAHASLACYLRFCEHEEVAAWLAGPFRKVICRISAADFEGAKRHPDHIVMTESALGGAETALAFRPRREWPKAFRFFKLYR